MGHASLILKRDLEATVPDCAVSADRSPHEHGSRSLRTNRWPHSIAGICDVSLPMEDILSAVVTGVFAGVVGTLVMDVLNVLVARTRWISRIDVATIGRMAAGWARGRFVYSHPREMQPVRSEVPLGILTHYTIGVALAVPFVVGWSVVIGGAPSPVGALVYGIGTTVASWCFVYPSMGFGAFGLRSPDGLKATLSSLANHLFYGLGLGIGVAVF